MGTTKRIFGSLHPFFEGGPIQGRKIANATFMEALTATDFFDEYHIFLPSQQSCQWYTAMLAQNAPELARSGRFIFRPVAFLPKALADVPYYCFHFSDWMDSFVSMAILRNAYSQNIFPITGPVHTLSYTRHAQGFFRHMWGGVSPRDVIIATSEATQEVITCYFNSLRSSYQLPPDEFKQPGIKQIPLGVHTSLFAGPEEKKQAGAEFRARLGLRDNQCLFLSFSRISNALKMDFLPLFDAFARAHTLGLTPDSYHLAIAGAATKDDPYLEMLIQEAKKRGIPCSLVQFPQTPSPENRKNLFAAADVFVSPVDNLQETFGLTILEAYCASLPVIASAIDGYKELVLQGQTGFLIPTLGPASVSYSDRLGPVLDDGSYLIQIAQQSVLELTSWAKALVHLGQNAVLRQKMGQAGYALVQKNYTWETVIQRYIHLWQELADKPIPAEEIAAIRRARHPLHPECMKIFHDYFSARANAEELQQLQLRPTAKGSQITAKPDLAVIYEQIRPRINLEHLQKLLSQARNQPTFAELTAFCSGLNQREDAAFLLLWCLKHDLLEFVQNS